jgi:hypothetical protein
MEKIIIKPGYAERKIIRPRKIPYLEERGWQKNGNGYEGYYTTKKGSWRGKLKQIAGQWDFYILDPPKELLKGEHQACFKHVGNNLWWIHWSKKPGTASEGILNIERLIEKTCINSRVGSGKQSWWQRIFEGG